MSLKNDLLLHLSLDKLSSKSKKKTMQNIMDGSKYPSSFDGVSPVAPGAVGYPVPAAYATPAAAAPEEEVLIVAPAFPAGAAVPEAEEGTVSSNKQEPQMPKIYPDEYFGGCMYFDGNSNFPVDVSELQIEVSKSEILTLCIWIYVGEFGKSKQSFITIPLEYENIDLAIKDEKILLSLNDMDMELNTEELQENKWYHLAFVFDNKNKKFVLFIDGQLAAKKSKELSLVNIREIIIGGTAGKYFIGKSANLRLYNKALSEKEISADMLSDQSAQSVFNKASMVDFRLSDDEGNNVLYISDDIPLFFHFELTNSSNQDINICAVKDQYNFMLKFKPNTFENGQIKLRNTSYSWDVTPEIEFQTGEIMLKFSKINGDQILGANQTVFFELEYGGAGKKGGARGTNVQLTYQNISYLNTMNTMMQGTRLANIDIVNQRGKKSIPLYCGFKGSDRVINDGETQNELTLCIANISKASTINLYKEGTSSTPTQFIIYFKTEDELALCSDNKAKVIVAEFNNLEWELETELLINCVQWKFTNKGRSSLLVGDMIEFKFLNIVSDRPCGSTTVEVLYQNIPGYWDGNLFAVIQKSPLKYDDNCVFIGSGNSSSKAKLDVKEHLENGQLGTVFGHLKLGDNEGEGTFLGVRGFGTQQYQNSFAIEHSFSGNTNSSINFFRGSGERDGEIAFNTNNNTEQMRITSEGNIGIGSNNPNNPHAKFDIKEQLADGQLGIIFGHLREGDDINEGTFLGVRGYGTQEHQNSFAIEYNFSGRLNSSINFYRGWHTRGGEIAFNTDENTEKMRITGEGNVGIGTNKPTAKLEVDGRIKDQTGYVMPVGSIMAYAGSVAPEGWLLCDGQKIPDGDKYAQLRGVVGENTPNLCLRTIIGAGKNDSVPEGGDIPLNAVGGFWEYALKPEEIPDYNFSYDGGLIYSNNTHANSNGYVDPRALPHPNVQPYLALNYIIKY